MMSEIYHFLNAMKGAPAHWENVLYEFLAIVKQTGLPPFNETKPCHSLHWTINAPSPRKNTTPSVSSSPALLKSSPF